MRLLALILAANACAHLASAASVPLAGKLDLDNVEFDDELANVVNPDLEKIEGIPVKVIEEPVLDENSNDYIPPEEFIANVKRIEVDLLNPGPPQRQEHETQNPENYSDNDKIVVAIKRTIEQAENIFNEGLKGVSDSFKTFSQANEDLPSIQQNIKTLKDTFSGQIEKLNETIRTYLKPETAPEESSVRQNKLDIVQARLRFLENNFKLGVDTLTEGVEVYSIIKEEDEAEKAIALKANVKADAEAASSVPAGASEPAKPGESPSQPAAVVPPQTSTPWGQYITNFANSVAVAFNNMNSAVSNVFNGGNNANAQDTGSQQQTNPFSNLFSGINFPNIGQVQQPAQGASDASNAANPANTQADTVPAPAPVQPAPWSPQGILQSVQTSWNNLVNPGQNNQQQQTPQPANTNPIQQAIQNIVSVFNPQSPQTPQAQQPANPPGPVTAVAPEKVSQSVANEPEAPAQGNNVVPAAVNDQPQTQAQPNQVNPVAPAGPIQQLVQNNPIIKGIQSAVQRIQGHPETPREEIVQVNQKKEVIKEVEDPKAHHGGYRPDNQGDSSSNSSGRVAEKVEGEKTEIILTEEKEVLEEKLQAEELKTPPVSDKTE